MNPGLTDECIHAVDVVNNANRGMPFLHTSGAKTIAIGMGAAKLFWRPKSQSLHPGAPVAIKTLKDLLAVSSFLKVR